MRKFLVLFLSLFALLGFTSCEGGNNNGGNIEEKEEFTVTFDSNGGSSVQAAKVGKGAKVAEPETPVLEGYDFKGWYKDEECTKKWSFDSNLVVSDMTLYAKWEEKVVGAEYEEITIAEALDICKGLADGETSSVRYKITGTVDSIVNPGYGQMIISDETGSISVYGSYSADGEVRYAELAEKPYKGDTVILAALLQNFKGTAEISSGWILDFTVNEIEIDVNDYTEMSVKQVRESAKGTKVKVSGVVAQITYANGFIPSGFYLVDNTESIYVYDSQITPKVAIGNTVTVIGERDAWILADEVNSANKFGYNGCTQISSAYLLENDNQTSEFNKDWISEKTVKEIMDTPASVDITTTIFKVNALVKKAPGNGFINYYIDDLDGTTGSYVYTQCNGNDLDWLEEFDGKICTVYLSVINAKSSQAGCVWRFLPVLVKDEGFTFDLADAPKFAVDYYGIDQFDESYTGNPEKTLVTKVSSELLGFENVVLSYSSNNEDAVYFTVTGEEVVFNTKNPGKATITITANHNNNEYSTTVEVTVLEKPLYEAITVKEAIEATFDTEVTVKGIAGPSLVNQVGFYLIDETGIIAVKTDEATMASITFGQEVVMKGTRKRYIKTDKEYVEFGQSCLLDSTLVVNLYGNYEYNDTHFVHGKTLADIFNLDPKTDFTTTVYVIDAVVSVVETSFYTKIELIDGNTKLSLYSSSANQYNWLKQFANERVTMEVAPVNWNAKSFYVGCVLAVINADGTKVTNQLNYSK